MLKGSHRLICRAIFYLLFMYSAATCAPISQAFVQKHLAPTWLQEQLDAIFADKALIDALKNQRADILEDAGFLLYTTRDGNIIAEHPALPNWLIKGPRPKRLEDITGGMRNLLRIPEANKIRYFIEQNNYEQFLVVPRKYYYHYPDHPFTISNDNYCVIAEKIHAGNRSVTKLSGKTLRALMHTAIKTGFWDTASHLISSRCTPNIITTHDKRAAFIDTEPFTLKTILLNVRYYTLGF